MQPLYRIENLQYQYLNTKPILEIEKLNVMPGSILGFIGPNGSGKSTLLKLMGFLEKANQGKIIFNGHDVNPLDRSIRLKVTLLTQKTYLMKRSVYQNVTYGLKIRQVHKKHHKIAAKWALSMVGLDFDMFVNRPWNTLSGGEARRVALAARLICKPKVLLMDEPTVNLDSKSSELIKKASIMAKNNWGTTLIITSHDTEWLSSVCDKIMFISRGKLTTHSNNIILGPWKKIKNSLFKKDICQGQKILVSPPPHINSIAFINPLDIRIYNIDNTEQKTKTHTLKGIIKQLRFEDQLDRISIQISIGGITLTSTLTTTQILNMKLFPSKPVNLIYSPNKIEWK